MNKLISVQHKLVMCVREQGMNEVEELNVAANCPFFACKCTSGFSLGSYMHKCIMRTEVNY